MHYCFKGCEELCQDSGGLIVFGARGCSSILTEKSKKSKDSNGVSGFEKSDLLLDSFLVQHEMENMTCGCLKRDLRMHYG